MFSKRKIFFLVLFLSIVNFSFAEVVFSPENISLLKPGLKNKVVKEFKQNLHELGYFKADLNAEDINFSESYDKELFEAIKDFQKENSLPTTGRLDKSTRDLLTEMNNFLKANKIEEDQNEFLEGEMNYFSNEQEATSVYNQNKSWLDYISDLTPSFLKGKTPAQESQVVPRTSNTEYTVPKGPKHFIFRCFLDSNCNSI